MLRLPDFPWDTLADAKALASAHPGGLVDLSVGSPVDPTPKLLQRALREATDAHGYPTNWGTPEARRAIVEWFARVRGVPGLTDESVLVTVGSKELVAGLPQQLGLGPGDAVVHPAVAYPTYDIGARMAGATPVPADDPGAWPESTRLVWLNSPSNPTGAVLGVDALRRVVRAARERGVVVASDECYALLPWEVDEAPSILDPRVTDGDLSGLIAVYSLSKQSNLAGYRAAFIAGDAAVVQRVLAVRKHLGLMAPSPVQHALAVALGDASHVDEQRERYRARRALLLPALRERGFAVESEAGLYLWATDGTDALAQVDALARLGILVAPGTFYGDATHVRVALTASDDDIAEAAARLRG
ncbi:succinyldiaminopimelate transaminase [Agrococcus sp. SCSIO52902]|uniref:succinyldiaminopimelate transaminase n=1 Tax=Agrococcus sp. SCSIO52902 TaxID=2933290 RepID=UPI001FF2B2CC|nr:succinyldiaminopimelate transaminase [Agrococcus sp. SCSIO52902]UOW00961.1 succinyldiaminopimelate transaminase [Agrococcus sp. SCSIO52902]